MTKNEVSKIMAVIAAAWRNFEATEAKLNIWFDLLKDLDFKSTLAALKRLMSSGSPFAPAVSEIRKEVALLTLPAEFRLDLATAWQEASRAVKYYGSDEQEGLNSLSLLVRKAVEALGWDRLLYDDAEVVRAHFIKFYTELRDNALKEMASPPELRISQPAMKSLPEPKKEKREAEPQNLVSEEVFEKFSQKVKALIAEKKL